MISRLKFGCRRLISGCCGGTQAVQVLHRIVYLHLINTHDTYDVHSLHSCILVGEIVVAMATNNT